MSAQKIRLLRYSRLVQLLMISTTVWKLAAPKAEKCEDDSLMFVVCPPRVIHFFCENMQFAKICVNPT